MESKEDIDVISMSDNEFSPYPPVPPPPSLTRTFSSQIASLPREYPQPFGPASSTEPPRPQEQKKLPPYALAQNNPIKSTPVPPDPKLTTLATTANNILSISNAFQSHLPVLYPPFPSNLTITGSVIAGSIVVDEVKTFLLEVTDIDSFTGSGSMVIDDDSGEVTFVTGLRFGVSTASLLHDYLELSGTYTLTVGGDNPFTGGTGAYTYTRVGQTFTLTLDSFNGTTVVGPLTAPSVQEITFDRVIPSLARDMSVPCIIKTTNSSVAYGALVVQEESPTIITIQDSDAVSAWQWSSNQNEQGWSVVSMTI